MQRLPFVRIVQNVGVQLVAALGPFIVLPLIARGSDASEWSSFVLGQSFGLMLASVASYGWAIVGVTSVARSAQEERARVFVDSLATRALTVFLFGGIGLLILLLFIKPTHPAVAFSVCSGFLLVAGFSTNWYFVGTGEPWKNLIYGTSPVLLAGAATVFIVFLGGPTVVYGPLLVLLGAVVMILVLRFEIRPTRKDWAEALSAVSLRRYFKREFSVFLAQSITAVYIALPMALGGANLPVSESARYATADRVNTLSMTGVGTVGKVLQGWRSESLGIRRAHAAFAVTVGCGAVGGVVLAVWGGWLTSILFGAEFSLSSGLAILVGLFTFLISCRYSFTRYYLVPAGLYKGTTVASAVSFLVLGATLLVMSASLDMVLIAQLLCISELLGVLVLGFWAFFGLRASST